MTEKDAKIAIESRLNTGWAAAGYTALLYPLYFENVNADEPGNIPWASLHILDGEQRQISMSSNPLFRQVGIIDVRIRVPINSGQNTLYEIAAVVKNLFRGKTFSGIRCYNAESAKFDNGQYWQMNISFPFQWDENYAVT